MSRLVELGHSWGTRAGRSGCGAALLAATAACAGEMSTLEPAGPAAARVAELWWVMFAGAMLILAGVVGAALYSLRRARPLPKFSETRVLVGWGLVFPTLVLALLMAFAFLGGERLLARSEADALTIRAHAEQWSWTFEYAGGERTRHVVHVPAGEPFRLRVTSGDVIHSLWVPRLGGKIDAIPGRENVIALEADAPGVYRGTCAEYCGVGHARMFFDVHAHPPARYRAVLAEVEERPAEPRPPVEPRRAPASDAIANTADYILRWLGLR